VWSGRDSTLNKKDVVRGRVEHIDIARGISITLVALFHSDLAFFIPAVVEPMSVFRMPLFLVLSGVFFSYSIPPAQFILKKADTLLKPYLFVLIVALGFHYLSGGEAVAWKLKGIFYGNGDTIQWDWVPLWFLTHLFALYVFVYCLFSVFGFDKWSRQSRLILLVVFSVTGVLLVDVFWYAPVVVFGHAVELPGLPFSVDIIMISSVYFILGYMLKDKLVNFTPSWSGLILCTGVFLLISVFTEAHTDLNKRVYNSPLYAFVGAVAGIYGVLTLSWVCARFDGLKRMFQWLGKASLFIMIFHVFIGYWVYFLLSENVADESLLFLIAIASYLMSLLIPLAIKNAVERNALLSLVFFPLKSNRQLRHALRVHRRAKAYAVVQK